MERKWAFHCMERSGDVTIHLFKPTPDLWELYCERDGYPMTYMFGIPEDSHRYLMDYLFELGWANIGDYINDGEEIYSE